MDEARRSGGGPGAGTLGAGGPAAPERAVALVEQLAASLDAPGPHRTGFAVGTLAYMAPEHFLGCPVGRPADVYAVACILYELLAGTPPFTGDPDTVIAGHLRAPLPSLRVHRRDLPPALDGVLAVGAAKNPHDRYPTAGALAAAARAALAGPPASTVPVIAIPRQAVRTPAPPPGPPTRWAPPPVGPPPAPMPPARRAWGPVVAGAVAAALLAAAVGTGLWLAPSRTSPEAGQPAPLVGGVPTGIDASVVGTWTGTYTCAQGATGLQLEVSGSDEASLSAVFRFSAVPANPGVPSGSFSMTGTQFGRTVDLRGSSWLSRPQGYQTVDLGGRLSDDGATFDGQVRDAGGSCTTFHLTRAGGPSV